MPAITEEQVRRQVEDLGRLVEEEYKPQHPPKKRDWRTYEEQWAHRLRQVMRDLGPLVQEACAFASKSHPGPKSALTLEQKVQLLLIKVLDKQSNRRMAGMLVTFSLLSGLDVSYKSVERLYSDPEVQIALLNLHTLMMKRRGVRVTDATGDGTGYALSIAQHYATTATKEKERAKENPTPPPAEGKTGEGTEGSSGKKVKRFVYSFRLLDLRTWLYVAYATSLRSERAAYDKALAWLKDQGIEVESVRLDRYYSHASDAARFPGATFYMLPRKDAKVHLQHEYLTALREFVERPLRYLEGYYQREHSEAANSADKRMLGWTIPQRREDRITTADECHSTWHNLLNLYRPDRDLSGGHPG
ncbi:MAG: ISNCY-like element ISFac3 family transposase [Acidimicrobiales bacterium]